MFDRDEHPRFDEAKNMAYGNGIRLAISNPCFELWGILHYQEYNAPLDRHECQRKLGELCPYYSNKKKKSFDDTKVIEDNYRNAVRRAENSLARREEEGDPEGNPSTTVYRLTEHILYVTVIRPLLAKLSECGAPVPDAGFELTGDRGAVIAEAVLAWPAHRIAVLLPDQKAHAAAFEARGWQVFESGDENLREAIASVFAKED